MLGRIGPCLGAFESQGLLRSNTVAFVGSACTNSTRKSTLKHAFSDILAGVRTQTKVHDARDQTCQNTHSAVTLLSTSWRSRFVDFFKFVFTVFGGERDGEYQKERSVVQSFCGRCTSSRSKGVGSDSDDDNTDDDFFLSSDEEESLDALSDPESDVEQDADSDDHAAVRVLEQDGEFSLPRARGRGRGRAANRLGRQLAGRRGVPGAARVARAANRGALRGVARGGLQCRGRGRGVQPAPGGEYKTWEEEDDHVPPVFEFEPQREAGFHFPEDSLLSVKWIFRVVLFRRGHPNNR